MTAYSPPEILIVTDSSGSTPKLKQRLESHGCSVKLAGPGFSSLSTAGQKYPDLIVLLVEHSAAESLDIYRKLETEPNLADTPLALLTTPDCAKDISSRVDMRPMFSLPKDASATQLLQIIQETRYLMDRYL